MNKKLFIPFFGLAAVCIVLLSGCDNGGGSSATTENGFQYTHHIQNDGAKPQPGDQVFFHYQVFLDDSLLQASYDSRLQPNLKLPTAEEVKKQPDPVIDVLPLMSVGDSITVSQSLDSLPQRPPGFEKFNDLIYTVALYDIKNEEEYKVIAEAEQKKRQEKAAVIQARLPEITELSTKVLADYNGGKLNGKLTETATGLKYIVHEEGTEDMPNAGDLINVHYYGMLTDGKMFDNSFTRGEPISFPVGQGQVIPGWDEGLTILKKGSKATLFIPYQLAYGEAGSPPNIPANADLVFYVELLDSSYE